MINSNVFAQSDNNRPFEDLIAELKIVHVSTKAMFQSFTPKMLLKTGIGFTLAGHQKWHFRIIEERYMSLLA